LGPRPLWIALAALTFAALVGGGVLLWGSRPESERRRLALALLALGGVGGAVLFGAFLYLWHAFSNFHPGG